MKRTIYSFLLAAVIFAGGMLQRAEAATKNYTLSYRDDPATTMVIGWTGDGGTVHYGSTDNGQTYTAYPNSQAVDRSVTVKGQNRKFVRLSGLNPKTVYYFVIHDATGTTSQRFKFVTLSDDPNDEVSFISGGDTRRSVEIAGIPVESCPTPAGCRGERQEGNQLVAKFRPDFVIQNGDFVRNTLGVGVNQEWEDWMSDWQLSISADGRMYPLVMTQGNHEDAADMYNMFDIPQDEYYVIDVHGNLIRLYILNSELDACTNTAQLNWLTSDLQAYTGTASEPIWKMAQYHIPTYAQGNSYGLQNDQMTCWVPLFEQYDIKLVMESHTHITKWTHPCVANGSGNDFELATGNNGVVYIGEGQWGAPHRSLDFTGASKKPYVRDQDVFDNFFFIKVSQDTIDISCIKFENVSAVGLNFDDELGSNPPSGVTLWNPAGGSHVFITKPASSITENATVLHQVFPVPSRDFVNVELGKLYNDNVTIEVFNSLGKLCSSETLNGVSTTQIDISGLCTGVSYVRIKTPDGKVESHRIVKTN